MYASTRRGKQNGSPQGSPKLWPQLGGKEVRGPSPEAVSAGVADTAAYSVAVSASAADSAGAADSIAVERMTAPPVPGVQKPPRRVGKQFQDLLKA